MPAPSATLDRRERRGWYTYDWASSAFSTTVVTVFLGPYLTVLAQAAADGEGFVRPFGIPVAAGSYFAYAVSASVLLQVLCLPILGAIADFTRVKKHFLGLFAMLGAAATMGLFFVDGTNYGLGGVLLLVANVSFGASVVFYNAFLPEIAASDQRDAVSSRGWAAGYAGGGLLLALNVVLFTQAPALGIETGLAVRLALLSAGVWWAGFTIVPLLTLRSRAPLRQPPPGSGYLTSGFRQLWHTARTARAYPHTLLFLLAYVFFNDGVQTVIALSSQFGQEELGLPIATLTQVVLLVQFVAIFGALGFLQVARVLGTQRAIAVSLVVWLLVVAYAYAFLRSTLDFFILAAVIALVLGGTQALSRALFSQMIPRGQEAEYFSLYEVSDRGTSWIGPLLFGLTLQFTGSYRAGMLSLLILFVLGLVLLVRVDVPAAMRAVARQAGPQVT